MEVRITRMAARKGHNEGRKLKLPKLIGGLIVHMPRRAGISTRTSLAISAYAFFMLLVWLGVSASAQTFTTLHNFAGFDGGTPIGTLVAGGNTLYGTTAYYGSNRNGTIFAINTNGTGFTNLYTFTATFTNKAGLATNNDGANPEARLILSGNTLFGVAYRGGISNAGTVFSINTDGSAFTLLHGFTNGADGRQPFGSLVLAGNTLYGAASYGGKNGNGTLFSINTNGTGFSILRTFSAAKNNSFGVSTNSDGENPSLVLLRDNTLYGVSWYGGSAGSGNLFSLNTNGSGFTILHAFTATRTNSAGVATNDDGSIPHRSLYLSGNLLYGTASAGGANGSGTIFAINVNDLDFSLLHSFSAYGNPGETNRDGVCPYSDLSAVNNYLYGSARFGGLNGSGTIFAITTNGLGFNNVYTFAATATNHAGVATNGDGTTPWAGIALSGNTLYGAAIFGGTNGFGTVFGLSFAPQLAILNSGANVVLSWPVNVAGFDYTGYAPQSATNLISPAVWNAVSPSRVVVNGQETVTNQITGAQNFYRLIQ